MVLLSCYKMTGRLTFAVVISFIAISFSSGSNSYTSFDYLILVQQWPQSLCLTEKGEVCVVPENVKTWTLHGLWPTKTGTEGPYDCGPDTFNCTKLQLVRQQLDRYWPNLFTKTDSCQFWHHEWAKHGTCAVTIKQMSDELSFFNTTLQLRQKYDLTKILHAAGIVPSNTTLYGTQNVADVIKKAIGGFRPKLECKPQNHNSKTPVLLEVYICLSKTFDVINCGSGKDLSKVLRLETEEENMVQSGRFVNKMNQGVLKPKSHHYHRRNRCGSKLLYPVIYHDGKN